MIGAAIFNQYYVIAANLAASEERDMGGHSAVYSPKGEVCALLEHNRPGIVHWPTGRAVHPYFCPGDLDRVCSQ
jgi:predicted amidohydrolase